ncbi:MAG: winged helix-turn-helix domain-containing protein [Bacteroidaceae bacterium]
MKTMITNELIGTYAGIVWNVLDTCGEEFTITELTKKTTLTKEQVNLAIGWLAREDKINFCEINDEVCVYLSHTDFYF